MEIQGKIILALPVKTGTSARGEWKVQEFVLETLDAQFPRKMVFSVFGEERLQRFNIQVGQDVNVSFDIDAREYQGKWFNSIRAFDVRQVIPNAQAPTDMPPFVAASPAPATPQASAAPFGAPATSAEGQNAAFTDSSEDLPF
ncbi:MAG: DUF3127 domain-containing protein [Prevotella sp.]|nr:DUF3127 domain-containing protein [Prevotella sp.]